MSANKRNMILFHGTTSELLDDILANGMRPAPDWRPSFASSHAHERHLASLDGTYAATSMEVAEHYALKACSMRGGDPILFALKVPLDCAAPDEDRVQRELANFIERASGVSRDDWSTRRFDREAIVEAMHAIPKAIELGHLQVRAGKEDAARTSIALMLAGAMARLPAREAEAVIDEEISPAWIRRLTSDGEGLDLYRKAMTELTDALIHASPENDADFDVLTFRIGGGIDMTPGTGRAAILSFGPPHNPFETDCASDLFTGDEISLGADYIQELVLALRAGMGTAHC